MISNLLSHINFILPSSSSDPVRSFSSAFVRMKENSRWDFLIFALSSNWRLFSPFYRSLTAEHIPFNASDLVVLICNSNVKHELSFSEYPTRRKQCSEALELMGLSSYREANLLHLRGEYWQMAVAKYD